MKKCGKCQAYKDEAEFNKNKSTRDGLQTYCRGCQNDARLKWVAKYPGKVAELSRQQRKKNPEKANAAQKRWRDKNPDKVQANIIRKLYGITQCQWQAMFDAQQGKCAICGLHQDELDKKLSVDHNHATGKVRALLCCQCNRAIGLLRESIGTLQNAIEYLKKHN